MASGQPLHVMITEGALSDLTGIADYIAIDSPQNAGVVLDDLLRAIESLDRLSTRFKVVGAAEIERGGRARDGGAAIHRLLQRRRFAEGGVRAHDPAREAAAAAAIQVMGTGV